MDVLSLALRYLRTRRIAYVGLLCVAVAVCAMVVVTAVMDGFQVRIRGHVRGTQADLRIRLKGDLPPDHEREVRRRLEGELAANGGPIAALAPRLESVGIAVTRLDGSVGQIGEDRWHGVHIIGIDWPAEREVVPLDRILDAVEDPRLRFTGDRATDPLKQGLYRALVGRSLARKLGLALRNAPRKTDELILISGRVDRDAAGETRFDGANLKFIVAGAYASGREDYDGQHVYVSREAFRRLRYGGDPERPDATALSARLAAGVDLDAVVLELRRSHPDLAFESWKDLNRSLLDAINVEKRIMFLILLFIVIVAASMVMGLLYMMAVEKTRDVGILRSMGMSRRRVLVAFLVYGSALGALGVVLGVVGGLQIVWHLDAITSFLRVFGIEIFSRNIFLFDRIPAVVDPVQVTVIATASLLLALAAGAVGSFKAASLDPVDCLNYE